MLTIRWLLVYAVGGLVTLMGSTSATAVSPELLRHPDPARAKFYADHSSVIDSLHQIALSSERTPTERLGAVETLRKRYLDAAVDVALELLSDSNLQIASKAANILTASITMSDHVMHPGVILSPLQEFIVARHAKTKDKLRSALLDPRPEIRSIIAGALTSLSDIESIRIIQEGVRQGVYAAQEAVNYFGLSDIKTAAPFMEPYLDTGSIGAQAAAVAYLGAYPQYQAKIRRDILQNAGAASAVRVEAAKVLSRYDIQFSTYASTITQDTRTPPMVFSSVMQGVIAQLQAKGGLDDAQATAIKEAFRNYQNRNPGVKLPVLEGQLKGL